MIRRAILVAAAAVMLILAPSVAMAYNAPGFSSSVSDSTPAIGQPITMTVNGAGANEMMKLVITSKDCTGSKPSTMALSKKANANGVVKFTFKLSAACTYTVQALDSTGALVSDQILTVASRTVASQAASALPSTKLGTTGFEGMPLAVGGGVLVLAGAGAVLVARRRRSAKVPA